MSAPPLFTRGLVAVLAVQSLYGFGFSTFILVPKFLAAELGAGPQPIGEVAFLFGLASVLSLPLAGAWVDRFGRVGFLRAGIALAGLASAAFLLVTELGPLVYVLRFAQGVSWGLAFSAAGAIVVDRSPPERMAQAVGLFGVSMLAMNAVAPVVAELLTERGGWAPVFLLATGTNALALLGSLGLAETHVAPEPGTRTAGVVEVARRPRSLWLLAIIATNGAAFGAMFTFSQPFALELGMDKIGPFFVAYTLAAIAVRIGAGPVVDRMGRGRVSVVAGLWYGLVVVAMAALEPGGLAWLGAAFGLAHGFFYPALNAIALESAAADERGKVMALFNGSFNAGWAAGGIAFGNLAEAAGYPVVFACAGATALAGAALLLGSRELRARLVHGDGAHG